ncbi:MAG: 2-oxoglutarate and iron-dependent oxygenase domain-containing protein, partial [Alphaproteobacteria bacterium]|nr:2-oxoglutarate and iron-dependent oxygenase domain-containing protein [Alphaproteobacteria bacterium]
MTDRIPVIDLSAALAPGATHAARQDVAREINRACVDIGFFTIVGHGVPTPVIDALRDSAHEFFALPMAEKRRAIHPV